MNLIWPNRILEDYLPVIVKCSLKVIPVQSAVEDLSDCNPMSVKLVRYVMYL